MRRGDARRAAAIIHGKVLQRCLSIGERMLQGEPGVEHLGPLTPVRVDALGEGFQVRVAGACKLERRAGMQQLVAILAVDVEVQLDDVVPDQRVGDLRGIQ